MSIFKSIKGMLIEEEPKKEVAKPAQAAPAFKSHDTPVQPYVVTDSSLEQHFEELLAEANKNKFPGNDFYEFYYAKQKLSMLPSEDMRYAAAFAFFQNLTKDKLVETASQYNIVIDREIDEFNATFDKAYNDAVSAKKQQMEAKVKEMQDITQKMKQLENDLKTLNDEIIASESKLMGKKTSFVEAGNAMKRKIESEIANINTYIK